MATSTKAVPVATKATEEIKGLTYKEAEEKYLNIGEFIKLPEWESFWFKNIKKDITLVYTKDGQILDTPLDEFKERNDWQVANITDSAILERVAVELSPIETSSESSSNKDLIAATEKLKSVTNEVYLGVFGEKLFDEELDKDLPFEEVLDRCFSNLPSMLEGVIEERFKNPNNEPHSTVIDFDAARNLLNAGKSVQVVGQSGRLQIKDGDLKLFSNNGDFLAIVNLQDFQEEENWEEK